MRKPPFPPHLHLLPALCVMLLGCMTLALDNSADQKILEAVRIYQISLERGALETLFGNSIKSDREKMQPCLDNQECSTALRRDILFVKMRDFKIGEIKESLTPPGKTVTYAATRVFGESKPASQQSGSGELLFIREGEDWKMASVSWNPQKE
jgi:hypothetical protein